MHTVLVPSYRLRSAALLTSFTALLTTGCANVAQPPARAAENTSSADLAQYLAPFPPAAPGQIRWVIPLPAQAHENQIKVELLPSIRMHTDCNHHMAAAEVKTHTVSGWGYAYQVMGDIGPMVSTMMGCPASEAQARDVPIRTRQTLQRYNSRAPLVFYTPAQVTLRYRLWRGDDAIQTATPSDP